MMHGSKINGFTPTILTAGSTGTLDFTTEEDTRTTLDKLIDSDPSLKDTGEC